MKLMHLGKLWTGEGFPPDDPQRLAVLGVAADAPGCTCATHQHEDGTVGWSEEGHAPSCALGRTAKPGKQVVGARGDPVPCTCGEEWKGEGHAKTCAKRTGAAPCTCRALKWDGEGHSPECVSQQAPAPVVEGKKKKA
jgi:hypothetical protein